MVFRNPLTSLFASVALLISAGCLAQQPQGQPEARRSPADGYKALHQTKQGPIDWLHRADSIALWRFKTAKLAGCNTERVHLNFTAKITDRAAGHSGRDATLQFTLRLPNAQTRQIEIDMKNPFRPQYPTTKQIGFLAYGASEALDPGFVQSAIRYGRLDVILTWRGGGIPPQYQVGVNHHSMTLGFIR